MAVESAGCKESDTPGAAYCTAEKFEVVFQPVGATVVVKFTAPVSNSAPGLTIRFAPNGVAKTADDPAVIKNATAPAANISRGVTDLLIQRYLSTPIATLPFRQC